MLSDEARAEIDRRKNETGISLVQSVEDAIFGKDRFNSIIESEIAIYQQENGCSRPDAIEAMLIEAIALKHKNSNSSPGRQWAAERFDEKLKKRERKTLGKPIKPVSIPRS